MDTRISGEIWRLGTSWVGDYVCCTQPLLGVPNVGLTEHPSRANVLISYYSIRTTRYDSLEVVPTTLAQSTRQPEIRLVVTSVVEKGTFSSFECELWPMILTFELDLDMVKMNQHDKYLGQRSFMKHILRLESYYNKSSAIAEMGDRGHNRHGPKRGGGCCAPFAERWEPV